MKTESENPRGPSKNLISIVIPVFNEQENINPLFDRLEKLKSDLVHKFEWEFLFVNDGSSDASLEVLNELSSKQHHCKVINLARNFGHQFAVTAGIEFSKGDLVGLMDADLQDPPEVFIEMIKGIEAGNDVAYGKRVSRQKESFFKKISAAFFYRLLGRITNINIPADTGDFRLMTRKVVHSLKEMNEQHRFIRGMVAWVGYRSVAIPYHREPRYKGATKYPLKKMIKFAFDAIFSFSSFPLRLSNYIGCFTSVLGVCGMVWIAFRIFVFDDYIPGVSILAFFVLLIGGVQFFMIGILGEYIGRIFEQSKQRPLYLVDSVKNVELSKNNS